jgi:hypothetical protein
MLGVYQVMLAVQWELIRLIRLEDDTCIVMKGSSPCGWAAHLKAPVL